MIGTQSRFTVLINIKTWMIFKLDTDDTVMNL